MDCNVLLLLPLLFLQGGKLYIAPMLNSEQLVTALQPLAGKKILSFEHAASLFTAFVDPQVRKRHAVGERVLKAVYHTCI